MKVLVLNAGSSSMKYQLYDVEADNVAAKGTVGRIGEEGSYLDSWTPNSERRLVATVPNHARGLELIVDELLSSDSGVIATLDELSAVGHRVTHGGDVFSSSVLITGEVVAQLEEFVPLAPLHNPAQVAGIRGVIEVIPGVPQVAVFDTAFHATIPPKAYMYALPWELHEDLKVRRYGFHGTSYRYVSRRVESMLHRPMNELKVVIGHLGSGSSVVAIDHGKSVDSSMGLTPLEGLVMGTRTGDIDPAVAFYLHRHLGYSVERIDALFNKESGLLGISGVSNDVRDLVREANIGNERCQLALDMFAYRAKKYVGAYAAAMGGIDALVFTGGIGEYCDVLRQMICEEMSFIGIDVDDERNGTALGVECDISVPGSRVKVLVLPTDEERMIVADTLEVAGLRTSAENAA